MPTRRRIVIAVTDPQEIGRLLIEHGAQFTMQQVDDAINLRGSVHSAQHVMQELLRCGVMKWEDQ
jgi:hypothetical protein